MSVSQYRPTVPKRGAKKHSAARLSKATVSKDSRLSYYTLEADWLLGFGVPFCQVAKQLHVSPAALRRALHKAKRHDLARQAHLEMWGV